MGGFVVTGVDLEQELSGTYSQCAQVKNSPPDY